MIAETRPNDWDELAARLLAHLDAGTTDSADAPFTVAVSDYVDPTRWEREIDRIFRRSPGRRRPHGPCADPGFLSRRRAGGGARAHGAPSGRWCEGVPQRCRHRGPRSSAPDAARPGASPARTTHGPTTRPVPSWACLGARPSASWTPIRTASPSCPAASAAGSSSPSCIPARPSISTPGWRATATPSIRSASTRSSCVDERVIEGPNWKVAYDGYVDGYHLDILHKRTLGKDVMGNVMTCDAWGPHQRVAFPAAT